MSDSEERISFTYATGIGFEKSVSQNEIDSKRFEEEAAKALQFGNHFWVIFAAYKVQDPESVMQGNKILHMDSENFACVFPIGCYNCEQAYSPQIAYKRCRGEQS